MCEKYENKWDKTYKGQNLHGRKSPDILLMGSQTSRDTKSKNMHIATGHGGRDRMLKHVGKKYANITRETVDLFKSFCVCCQEKIKRPKTTGVVVRPILSQDFSLRCQVDLIDLPKVNTDGLWCTNVT